VLNSTPSNDKPTLQFNHKVGDFYWLSSIEDSLTYNIKKENVFLSHNHPKEQISSTVMILTDSASHYLTIPLQLIFFFFLI
jgi:hypothetical protein